MKLAADYFKEHGGGDASAASFIPTVPSTPGQLKEPLCKLIAEEMARWQTPEGKAKIKADCWDGPGFDQCFQAEFQLKAMTEFANDAGEILFRKSSGGEIQCALAGGHLDTTSQSAGAWFRPSYLEETDHTGGIRIKGQTYAKCAVGKYLPRLKKYGIRLFKKQDAKKATKSDQIDLGDAKVKFAGFLAQLKEKMQGTAAEQEEGVLRALPPREPNASRAARPAAGALQ